MVTLYFKKQLVPEFIISIPIITQLYPRDIMQEYEFWFYAIQICFNRKLNNENLFFSIQLHLNLSFLIIKLIITFQINIHDQKISTIYVENQYVHIFLWKKPWARWMNKICEAQDLHLYTREIFLLYVN